MTASTSAEREATGEEYPDGYSWWFWAGLVVGWIVITIGLRGLVIDASSEMPTNPGHWVLLYVKVSALHDAVVLPVIFIIGRAIDRVVPASIRAAVQAGLICAAIVTVFAYPFVRGFGRKPDNPTVLPQDYLRGLIIILAIVGVGTLLGAMVSWRRSTRTSNEERAAR